MRKIKRIAAAILAAALFTAALGGCAKKEEAADGGTSAAAAQSTAAGAAGGSETADQTAEAAGAGKETAGEKKELREMNVVLDWYPNALHTFIYTAIERGYYEEEGLDVKIQFPANANDALSLTAAGRAEIGIYYTQDVIQAVANQNVGIKSIGAIVQSPLNIVLALKDKNIKSPTDLVGKTVGYGGTALSESLIYCMMENVGANPEDVKLVDVGFELMSSMTTGNVDATIGCLVNHEVPQMEEEGFEVDYFMVTGYGIPNYYEAVFLANNEMIENEPEVLAGFLRASKKGFEDFKADPDGCLKILMDNQNEENFPLSQTVEEQSCAALLPLMETSDAAFLSQTAECWQENIDWMYESGLIDKKVEVSDVMAVIE